MQLVDQGEGDDRVMIKLSENLPGVRECLAGLAGFEVMDRFYEIGSHAGLKELNALLSR